MCTRQAHEHGLHCCQIEGWLPSPETGHCILENGPTYARLNMHRDGDVYRQMEDGQWVVERDGKLFPVCSEEARAAGLHCCSKPGWIPSPESNHCMMINGPTYQQLGMEQDGSRFFIPSSDPAVREKQMNVVQAAGLSDMVMPLGMKQQPNAPLFGAIWSPKMAADAVAAKRQAGEAAGLSDMVMPLGMKQQPNAPLFGAIWSPKMAADAVAAKRQAEASPSYLTPVQQPTDDDDPLISFDGDEASAYVNGMKSSYYRF